MFLEAPLSMYGPLRGSSISMTFLLGTTATICCNATPALPPLVTVTPDCATAVFVLLELPELLLLLLLPSLGTVDWAASTEKRAE